MLLLLPSGVDASPLMTWGTIEGTPLHIDTDVSSTPGQVFKIPKESIRDGIGLKLASKATKSQREKKKAAMAQATSTILGGRFVTSIKHNNYFEKRHVTKLIMNAF